MFLRGVSQKYWKDIEAGLISPTSRVTRILLYSVEHGLFHTREELTDWGFLQDDVDRIVEMPLMSSLIGRSPFWAVPEFQRWFPSKQTADSWKVQVYLAFIEAHQSVRRELAKSFQGSAVFSADVREEVEHESEQACAQASSALAALPEDQVLDCKNRMIVGKLIQVQLEKVNHLVEQGLLKESSAKHIIHRINVRAGRIMGEESDSEDEEESEGYVGTSAKSLLQE